jgi:hypothetical protein
VPQEFESDQKLTNLPPESCFVAIEPLESFAIGTIKRQKARGAQRSSLGRNTIRRAEASDHTTSLTSANDLAIRRALELAGVEFIDENGGGPGVRLKKRQQKKRT